METQANQKCVAKFDCFTADFNSGELWKQGHRLRVPELPFRLLIILIENAGEMVTREELRQRLWPKDLFIDFDNNLNTAIAKIRRILNDSAGSPKYIETVGGRGYRFIAPVETFFGANQSGTTLKTIQPQPHEAGSLGPWAGQIPIGVMRLDPSGRVLYTNPKWTEIVGFSSRQINGELWFRAVASEDSELVRSTWAKTSETRQTTAVEFRVHRPDGEIAWVVMNLCPECEDEKITGYLATLTDVSEQHSRSLNFNESEQRFRTLAEHLPGVVYICKNDANFTKVYVGGPTEALNGYTNEEIMNGIDTFPGLYREEDAERIRQEVQNAVATRRPYHLTYSFRHRSGEWKWAEEFGAGIFSRDGELLHLECFVSDITQRKAMQEALRQAQKMEALGLLAGGIAHDFNNLLTVIQGYSGILRGRLGEPNALRDLEEIEKAAARGSHMVQRLMAFGPRQFVQPTSLNPNSTVRELAEMLVPVVGNTINLILKLDPNVPKFCFDATEIQQVLLNLVINARDAMPNGGSLTIATSSLPSPEARGHALDNDGTWVSFRVIDTGTGMTPETRERIFEPFFTTKQIGSGRGLGLATVYGMVTNSGGRIAVESQLGVGTTFQLLFPAVITEESLENSGDPLSLSGDGSILVVEDDPSVLACTVDLLKQNGFAAFGAGTFADAIAVALSDASFDVLLTDIRLADGSGWDLAEHMVKMRPSVRVLYVSGYLNEGADFARKSTPQAEFLKKPFSPLQLTEHLRRLMAVPVN